MSAEQPNELPTLAEVAPRWADLTQKALYLARQEEELLAEAEALGRIDMPAIPAAPRKLQPPPQRTLSPATLAALGDLAIPEPPPPEYREPDPATESQFDYGNPALKWAADLNVRLNGVRDAIAIINAEMPRALAEGSRAYCDIVRDEYTARAARVCDALVELASAYVDHEDFLSRVKSAGVNAAFLAPLNLESTGLAQIMADVRSGGSEVHRVLARGADGGHFGGHAEAVDALRKPALPPAPEPFAEAVADLRAAEKARVDAREGRKRVIRWTPDGRAQRLVPRNQAEPKPPALAPADEPPTRDRLATRLRARFGRQQGTPVESADD